MSLSAQQQLEVIKRGAVQVLPEEELLAKLNASIESGQPLRVKYGADPSAPDIHLGHTVPLQKLRQFQDLGHIVVFIIGDFTAMVGDPTGRSKTRKQLTRQEVQENSLTYQEQVFKILDRDKTEVVYNSSWLSPLTFTDVIELTAKYTVARMLERDDFSNRYREGRPISVLEFLYPLMQGYDSVAIDSDIELGGTDQTFNLLVAREIQKEYGKESQAIVTLPLLEGIDGNQKMSKSLGNYVGIDEDPKDIYGKLMSISDTLMWRYYELLSSRTPSEISEFQAACDSGTNPMEFKKKLAAEITARFSDSEEAQAAAAHFSRVHQKGMDPKDIAVVELNESEMSGVGLIELLVRAGMVKSNSEARRKISEGAVSLNGEKITDFAASVSVSEGDILKLGKRRFARMVAG